MASESIVNYRNGAEVYFGTAACMEKSMEMFEEQHLPKGLFPVEDLEEFGYNRERGFFWFVRKKKREHTFKKINQRVSLATEVTGFVEPRRMRNLSGVKTRQFMLWIPVVEAYCESSRQSEKLLTFKASTGLSGSFPVSAFEIEEE